MSASSPPGAVAVITGAAGELGAAVARTLAARGDRVALIARAGSGDRLAALAAELGGPSRARAYAVAGLDPAEGWRELPARISRDFGAVPTLAALAAGGWSGGAAIAAWTDDAAWDGMMSANLATVHRALRALVPGMVAVGRGSVVVVGSRVVERPATGAGAAAYVASKAAAVALAQAVAAEVLEDGVRVNAVLPSTMDTPANRRAMPDADPSRWVSLTSAAGVIAFLLSEAARDLSGATLPLYGRA